MWNPAATRATALFLLAVSVPALLLAWYLLFPDHRPTPMLVVAATSYSAPCPPNAFAAEDAAHFRARYDRYDNIVVAPEAKEPTTSGELLRTLDDYLSQVSPGGPEKNVVLIYLSAHGLVNDQGEPCLLLPSHDPRDASEWLRFSEVLEVLASPSRLDGCVKVLLLDASRIEDQWRMGVVANAFPLALQSLLVAEQPTDCVVLSASQGLQAATAAPELSSTVFGHFASLGLRGAADQQGNGDEVVTLGELETYLATNVERWVAERRGTRQKPRVLTTATQSLPLVNVAGSAEAQTQPWRTALDAAQVSGAQQRVVQLNDRATHRLSPVAWSRLQYLLELFDAESLAGAAYADQAGATLLQIVALLDRLEAERHFPPIEPVSLAMRHRVRGDVANTVEADNESDAADMIALGELWSAWLEDPSKVEPPTGYVRTARFTWNRLAGGSQPIDQQQLAQAIEFCDLAGAASGVEYAEIALLRLLQRYVDWQSPAIGGWPGLPRFLAAREASEQLAAPADPRIHYLLGRRLAALDQSLAMAMDHILVGSDDSLYQADAILTGDGSASGGLLGSDGSSYAAADQLSTLILRGLNVRDDALAMGLFLSQLQNRRAKIDPRYRAADQPARLLQDALEWSDELDGLIAASAEREPLDDAAELRRRIDDLQQDVDDSLDAYRARVAQIQRELAGSDATRFAETPALLSCRIGQDAVWLHLREQWRSHLARPGAEATSGTAPPESPSESADLEYLRWIAGNGVGSLTACLQGGVTSSPAGQPDRRLPAPAVGEQSSPGETIRELAQFEGRLRRRLIDFPSDCNRLSEVSSAQLADQPGVAARSGFTQADIASRAAAPLADDRPWFQRSNTPTAQLRRLDLQSLLVGRGDRAIRDFWGDWRTEAQSANPYFAQSARRQAELALDAFHEAETGADELNKRRLAAEKLLAQWAPLQANGDLFITSGGEMLQPRNIEFRGETALQPGRVAVFFRGDDGKLVATYRDNQLEVRRWSEATGGGEPPRAQSLEYQLAPDEVSDYAALHAVALFRGNFKRALFSVGRGVSVAWQKPGPAAARVVVRGDSKQVSQIIFIVDCSASMYNSRKGWNKLDDGRERLEGILKDLAQSDEQYEVGLVFYGRRAGWPPAGEEIRVVRIDPEQGRRPYEGLPGFDVEVAFRPKRLDRWHRQDLIDRLGDAKPWGETPLYYALAEALKQFDVNARGPRHLIAITDGVDFVAKIPGFNRPATDKEDVVERIKQVNRAAGANVQVDVIEFGGDVTDKNRDRVQQGRAELREIVRVAGGKFYLADDAKKLQDALDESLRLDRYFLRRADQRQPSAPDLAELGQWTQIHASTQVDQYDVLLEEHDATPARVAIEGGEAIELVYQRPPENRFIFLRYDREMGDQQSAGDLLVATHMPTGRTEAPTFRASVQQENETIFSRRPQIVWAKIQPVGENSDRSYYIQDCQFEHDLPVPMLQLQAPRWPGNQRANIELSFAMSVDSLAPRMISFPTVKKSNAAVDGVQLEIQPEIDQNELRVVVMEKHEAATDQYPLHIQLTPPPDKATRSYFESDRSARHVFHYAVRPSNPQLQVLTREQIEAGGVGPIRFERVELPRR